MTLERYPPHARLARGTDLSQCWETGHRLRMRYVDIAWRSNTKGHARMGVVIPRFGNTAVARNRLQRRIREILRCHVLSVLPAVDLVVRARPAAYTAPFAVLRAELADGTARISQ